MATHTHDPADDARAREISAELTKVISRLMTAAGHHISSLAQATKYSRVRISQVMNDREGKYLWRLPMLVAVSRVLQVPLTEMIRLASGEAGMSLDELELRVSDATLPGSPERLRMLIARILSIYAVLCEKTEYNPDDEGRYEVRFRCTPLEIEQGVPSFYVSFSRGELDNNEVSAKLWRAVNYAEENGGLDKMPLWVALKKTQA